MRSVNTNGVFKALLLAGCASSFAVAAPAFAQAAEGDNAEEGRIVVTGSRIVRQDYEANSPIVTVGAELLENSSTSSVEVNLNKLPQFTPEKTPTLGGDIQATPTNTPGSATVSLRGIGSNRNLVLIDGRRATPANASMAVDINTIPSAAVERVEIISGGASSTYGADAVGGVVNFILKKNFQGIQMDGQYGISERGDAQEYTISGIMGTDFADGRGNISISMATADRGSSLRIDRPWFKDLYNDPNVGGNYFFPTYSGISQTGSNATYQSLLNGMFPNRPAGSNVSATGSLYFIGNNPVTIGASSLGNLSGASNFPASLIDGFQTKTDVNGAISQNFIEDYVNLPMTRYNFYLRGNYEINDWVSVIAQGYFNKTSTATVQQPGPIVGGWNVVVPRYANDATWLPSNLVTLLNARTNPNADWSVTGYVPGLGNREVYTDVDTYNMLTGLEGKIPGSDWTWDLTVSRGESNTSFLTTGVASLSRLRAVMTQPNFGAGFVQQGNAIGGGFGANRSTCTTGLNPFSGATPSADCIAAIKADLKETAVMTQTVVEANAQGKVVDLPAGDLRVALGATYRKNGYTFLEDTIKERETGFQDQALGIYPARSIDASLSSKEVYGEMSVPLLQDLPFIQKLELIGGIRYADSSVTGGSTTWKIEGSWEVTDWLRLRGGFNKAERAPNMGELYSFTQNFASLTGGDACSTGNPFTYSANPTANTTNAAAVKALCVALMDKTSIPGQPANSVSFYGNGLASSDPLYIAPSAGSTSTSTAPGFAFPYFVGNPALKAEQAKTITIGGVLTSPFESALLSRIRLAVDYYNIKVDDAIGLQSGKTLQQLCLDSSFNPTMDPNSFFCNNFQRGTGGGIGAVQLAYTNTGAFKTSGIDTQLDWSFDVGPGRLGLNMVFNYLISLKSSPFYSGVPAASQAAFTEYAGTLLAPDSGLSTSGAYRWKTLTNISYTLNNLRVGIQWQHLPKIATGTTTAVYDSAYAFSGARVAIPGPGAYDLFNFNSSYQINDTATIRFGVDNLFDRAPPLTGRNPYPSRLRAASGSNPAVYALQGGSLNTTNYDSLGRRFYIGVTTKF